VSAGCELKPCSFSFWEHIHEEHARTSGGMAIRTDERHYNPMGIVHGGILCDLADAAMGVAVASTMQEGEIFTTTSLQMYYFLQVREATLTARSTMVRRGQRTVYVECEIVDEGDRLVAKASSACLVTRSDPELGVLEPV
jgi:uncharacterized protein (TIGR00369 family)